MDWGRAKTILILSFLCLNLFLGYQLWEEQKNQGIKGQISQLQIDELQQRLKDAGIYFSEESISDAMPEMNNMKVLVKDLRDQNSDNSLKEISWDNNQLKVTFLQTLILPEIEVERNALYQSHIAFFDQYQVDLDRSTSGNPIYIQSINEYPVFTSQLELFIDEHGWSGYEQRYYMPEEKGASRQVVSAYTTLAVLLENGLLSAGEEVHQVRLGYTIEQLDTDVQFLVPAWRVFHTNGIHYINGFTGMVIGATKN